MNSPHLHGIVAGLEVVAVCSQHGEVKLIETGRPFDIGRCPECAKEDPHTRFPHNINFVQKSAGIPPQHPANPKTA